MKISKVTITGLDEKTNLESIGRLWRLYPFVEFGVLISENNTGNKPRYPSLECIKLLTLMIPRDKLALHVCGNICRDTMLGKNSLERFFPMINCFGRIQFNNVVGDIDRIAAAKTISKLNAEQVIFPINKSSTLNSLELAQAMSTNVGLLHDSSGGRGITSLPNKPVEGYDNGYAGGFGPHNFTTQMERLASVLPKDQTIWVDMESKVRTPNDWLDLNKVEETLKQARVIINGQG